MDKVLNQDEIDAMVRRVRGGQNAGGKHEQIVQPWDIRQAGQIGSEQMRAINQLHEVFARNLSNAIGAYLNIAFDCRLVSAEHLTYREFLQSLPETTYVASCDLIPADAVAVLQLDLAVAFPVIDLLLGGEGKGGDLEEKNLCLSLEVKMAETRGTLNMAVPAVVSNALLRKISADLSFHRPRSAVEARRSIEKRLLNATFHVELFGPNLTIPLQSLADVTPGALLTFRESISEPAMLMVDGMRLSPALAVRMDGRRAARILPPNLALKPVGDR